ncbi:MAG: restriction endonuclease [Slackia sp.]|nr:restriction endonuclease [Slackia sp.]
MVASIAEFFEKIAYFIFEKEIDFSNTGAVLASIACLFISLFFLWALFWLARFTIRWFMRRLFRKAYHVQCDSTVVVGLRLNKGSDSFTLAFPRWHFGNKDGSRDKRRSGNELLWGQCRLGVGSFKVRCPYPERMLWIVRELRKNDVSIQLCDLELANVRAARNKRHLRTASQLYDSFSNDPSGFERYCSWLYSSMGYRCETTAKTADGGFDVKFVDPKGKSGIMECKCYAERNTVSRPLIDKLVGVNAHERADRMVFVTTSQFSSGARSRASEFGVELVDGRALASLIDAYVSCDRDDVDFADVTWQQLAAYYPPDIRPRKEYF